MKKNLLTISALALTFIANAQVVSHVDTDATVYVSNKALVYNGGGMQLKATGKFENHGNVMIDGNSGDVFKTVDATGSDKATGDNFYNRINDTEAGYNFAEVGNNNTYGQLFITGLSQSDITGIVNQEYQRENHGDYQQISIPFYNKPIISDLSTELGASFNATRWSEQEILVWNNDMVRFDNVSLTARTPNAGFGYYILGAENSGLDASVKHQIAGRPYAELNSALTLTGAGATVNMGAGGNNTNSYNEKYNTYVQDQFEIAAGGTAWQGNFGKNIYQFGNPFLTNLDLSWIAQQENGGTTDGINMSNVYGVRMEVSGVEYLPTVGGGTETSIKKITFNAGAPTGDVDYAIVRPLGNFVIKFSDNTTGDRSFPIDNLRRFNYTPRTASTNYSVTAAKNANTSTVKQLGIVGLDENGVELGRTYYVVYPNASTGFVANNIENSTQYAASSTDKVGSFEEDINGGYDTNVWSNYWLYINEANENDFLGKNIKVVSYDPAIKSYKFEIRENAHLVENGSHELSQGIGFYYQGPDGQTHEVTHGSEISLASYNNGMLEYDFYYGTPQDKILDVEEVKTPSRTQIVYNPTIENYIVLFDPNWNKADIKVYDMSGRLILSESNIDTSTNFEIKLDKDVNSGYVVDVISETGQKLTKKILK